MTAPTPPFSPSSADWQRWSDKNPAPLLTAGWRQQGPIFSLPRALRVYHRRAHPICRRVQPNRDPYVGCIYPIRQRNLAPVGDNLTRLPGAAGIPAVQWRAVRLRDFDAICVQHVDEGRVVRGAGAVACQ